MVLLLWLLPFASAGLFEYVSSCARQFCNHKCLFLQGFTAFVSSMLLPMLQGLQGFLPSLPCPDSQALSKDPVKASEHFVLPMPKWEGRQSGLLRSLQVCELKKGGKGRE